MNKIGGAKSYHAPFFKMQSAFVLRRFAFGKRRFALLSFFASLAIFFYPAGSVAEWKQVSAPRIWKFPRDYGSHPEYRTEWWYFTGILSDSGGSRYGYQLTFFRQGIRYKLLNPSGPWDIRDIYLGHFALTDVAKKTF